MTGFALMLALLDWTDQEAADRVGVERSLMQRWRMGTRRPQKRFHSVLERVFQVSIEDLVRTDVVELMKPTAAAMRDG
jgi:ribosome-binding protein aMBF1 (putative translation factor)